MNKYFICLANSYKHGNRCIAGIEVDYDPKANSCEIVTNRYGNPKWFRPISKDIDGGAIPNNEAEDIKLFDLVEAENVFECPSEAQVENFFYSAIRVVSHISVDIQAMKPFCDCNRKTIFGNKGVAVKSDNIERIGYSIIMIEPKTVKFYLKDRKDLNKIPQPRAIFCYNDIEYDFPITDPDFRHKVEENIEESNSYSTYFLTLSLGVEDNGWHSKLVAAVIAF